MKRVLAVLSFLIPTILAGSAFAAGQFGSPEPLAREDGYSFGVGYFSYSEKFKNSDGFSDISAVHSQIYGEVTAAGWNLAESGEAFLRIGGADFEGGGITTGSKFYGNAGWRDRWYRKGNFAVGTVLQGSYYGGYEGKISSGLTSVNLKITGEWDASLGLGFQYRVLDMLRIYAGPYIGYASFKAERTATGGTPSQSDVKYESKQWYGGYAGARATIIKGLNIVGEARFGSDFSGGVSLSYSF